MLGQHVTIRDNAAVDISNDLRWILRARVVVGHDEPIGKTRGNLSHHRALADVTIAATTKDDMQLPFAMSARGSERLG